METIKRKNTYLQYNPNLKIKVISLYLLLNWLPTYRLEKTYPNKSRLLEQTTTSLSYKTRNFFFLLRDESADRFYIARLSEQSFPSNLSTVITYCSARKSILGRKKRSRGGGKRKEREGRKSRRDNGLP